MQLGTKKNFETCTKSTIAKIDIEEQRREAKHGEVFFCNFIINNGEIRKSPCFIVSNKIDNKDEDVVICSCTSQPAKSQFDVEVQLKQKTCIRTNKLYTIHRNQLLFKIQQGIRDVNKLKEIDAKLKLALDLK